MKRASRTILIWGLLLAIFFIVILNSGRDGGRPHTTLSTENALQAIDSGMIFAYRIRDEQLLLVTEDQALLAVYPPQNAQVVRHLEEAHVPYLPESGRRSTTTLLGWLLIPIAVLLALYYFLKKMSGGGQMNNIFELRKSKSRPVAEGDKAHFHDIGGHRELVEMLSDIVDFLQTPKRWTAAGTRLPRGVLLVGPPGTGKTLLARAVAGETQSAFFYVSAAEFVEMFVGVGAARVRDTFEKAAAQQPAVIFIDELDAIGRRRGSGLGTMHEEREQTLNQLLVLMDGLEHHERLIVMAATNRPDVLDPALLRSGRFDRLLRLEPPTPEERLEILKIHVRNKPLAASVVLESLAGRTEGFTGADLEALCNDAALLAVRRNRRESADGIAVTLTREDFDRALEARAKSGERFDRLDSLLVESVSQFSEPTGQVVVRVTLTTGADVEGHVLWMNAGHIKLRLADGSSVVVAKEQAERIVPLSGTKAAPQGDFTPDRWAGRNLDVG